MYQLTIPMALVDFLPVLFFGYAAALLQRDLYDKMRKSYFALFAAGTIDIFVAGFLKATWKLLYAAGICDFAALNSMMLPLQSIGFLLSGLGIMLMLVKKNIPLFSIAPAVFKGTGIFISMMVVGLGCICSVLSIVSFKMKKKWASAFFILSFLCSMGMGAMSGQDSTQAWVNWTEQTINCVGQGLLMIGVIVLDKAGLREFTL
ncbi:MAG: hypothetical protein Q4B26_20755 [Eubacteriales bacterium]|nr:hypothetical protein [Eubacteriales bacterium]